MRFARDAETRLGTGFEYRHVRNGQLEALLGQLPTEWQKASGTFQFRSELEFHLIVANNARPLQMYDTFIAARHICLFQLVETMRETALQGWIVPMLNVVRAVVEHVALLYVFFAKFPAIRLPLGFSEANTTLAAVYDHCGKSLTATRFDWGALQRLVPENLFASKDLEYKVDANKLDQRAKSIMTAIDGLGREVPDVRAVYEYLCEFVHPNIGTLLALTETAQLEVDVHGVQWVRKKLTPRMPTDFVKMIGPTIAEILKRVAACLQYSSRVFETASVQRASVLGLTQVVIRRHLSRHPGVYDRTLPCPCGSGAVVWQCCDPEPSDASSRQ